MRTISQIIVHCSATPQGREVEVEQIRKWHLERGWSDIGYHYVIDLQGNIHEGRKEEIVGAHTKGLNKNSIGICYIGGLDSKLEPLDTRTDEQINALEDLLKVLKRKYPSATIHGHNDFSSKACPSYDATDEYDWISERDFA